jgi:hypothetical protein
MKCDKCGVTDNGTGDWAHVCGPVKVKKSGMNERIQELVEQATSIVEMVGPQGYTSSYANFDKEKFAELIVRECIDVVEDAGGIDKYHYTGAIGKHFGVEE